MPREAGGTGARFALTGAPAAFRSCSETGEAARSGRCGGHRPQPRGEAQAGERERPPPATARVGGAGGVAALSLVLAAEGTGRSRRSNAAIGL